jgi:pSer/pThr/pTyr-binding forkhead associated (FHA) protein
MRDYGRVHVVVPPCGGFREPRKIALGPRPLTVGRGEQCEIRVDVPGVDQEHAKLTAQMLVAIGPDCAVGDVPLDAGQERLVMPGDEVQIGSVVLAVEADDPQTGEATATLEVPALGASRPPRVRVVEGKNVGEELFLVDEGREYVVGRAPTCDLVLSDREVSREHLKLVRRGYDVLIRDHSSTRGSWLGRSTVYPGATVEWVRPRMLRVGATVLSLSVPESVRRAGTPAQASAPMTPEPRRRSAPPPRSSRPAPALSTPPSPDESDARGLGEPSPDALAASEDYDPPPQPVAEPLIPPSVPADGGTRRRAWKKPGPSLGRVSGLLLLAAAGVVIAGGLLVVFSLLE